MTVFENVRDAMLQWNPRWEICQLAFQGLKNQGATGPAAVRDEIFRIYDVWRFLIPQGIGTGLATDLSDQEATRIWLLSHFFLNVVDLNVVSDERLQEIANTNPADILAVFNRHQAIFLPQAPQPFHFGGFDNATLCLLQAKAVQTLIERKILAATSSDSLNDLATAGDDDAIRAAIFKNGAYGDLAAAQASGAALLPDGLPAAIAQAQAAAMQALLRNPHFSREQRANVMQIAGQYTLNLKGLKFFAEADRPPTQVNFEKLILSGWVLEAITSPEKAKAAIVLLNQFIPSALNVDRSIIVPLLKAVDSPEKAEILRTLVVEYKINPQSITSAMLLELAQIPDFKKIPIIQQLLSGSPSPNEARKVELLTSFISFPPDQRCKEVAQGLSMMLDDDVGALAAIVKVVAGLKAAGKGVREKDLQDAIDYLSKVPPGTELHQLDCVVACFCSLNERMRTAPVAIALEKWMLVKEFIEIFVRVPKGDQGGAINLLVDLDKEKAIQALRVFKEAKEPHSGLLQQIIEAQKIKFVVVSSENKPEKLRESIKSMQDDYKMKVICKMPGQATPHLLPVSSPLLPKAKVRGLQATLCDESETVIQETFATKKGEKHMIEVQPQAIIKEKLLTLRTVEELAMYAKKRDMSIELGEMDPDNKVKVKVFLQNEKGEDEEKEIPFKALFFLAAAAQGMIIKEKGNTVFSPPKEGAADAEERVKDQKDNYLKSLGVDSWKLSSEQMEGLRDTLFPGEAPSSGPALKI